MLIFIENTTCIIYIYIIIYTCGDILITILKKRNIVTNSNVSNTFHLR